MMRLSDIQPSQLYICSEKLFEVMKTFNVNNPTAIEPIPIKKFGEDVIFVDGQRGLLRFSEVRFIGRMRSWTWMPTKSVLNGVSGGNTHNSRP
ncbi:MAG: hypothetical protein ACP5JW_06890 [Candidatus Bathyarchaeia archaeon]